MLGEDFNLFRVFVWHCMNFIEGSAMLLPCFDLLIIRLLKVALMGSSSHCLIHFKAMLSRFSMIQVFPISVMVRFQEIFESRRRW